MKKGIIAVVIISSVMAVKVCAATFESDRVESGKIFAEFSDSKPAPAPVVSGRKALAKSALPKSLAPGVAAAVKPALAAKIPHLPGQMNGAKRAYSETESTLKFAAVIGAIAVAAKLAASMMNPATVAAIGMGCGIVAAVIAGVFVVGLLGMVIGIEKMGG